MDAQSLSVTVVNAAVRVHAPGFHFIDGEALTRLKDGQSVRVDLEVSVLEKPGASAFTQRRLTFILSYDLWEERFAVSVAGAPSRTVSHLGATGAEAWCVQQLDVPVNTLGPLASLPFWVRLESRVFTGTTSEVDDGGFSLRGLIDALSRRKQTGDVTQSLEAGPFSVRR